MLEMFFKLLIGHAVADFWAQSENMRLGKSSLLNQKVRGVALWPYCLTAHALIHGGAVWLLTGSVWLGLAETVAHWLIDFGKTRYWYNIPADQGMHVGCKIIWSVLA